MTVTQAQVPTLAQLRDEAVTRTAAAAGLNDGTEVWQDFYPEAGCHSVALDMAIEDMRRAWAELEAAERGDRG
jgi:hypothetical protein